MSRIIRPIAAIVIGLLVLFFFVRPMAEEMRTAQAESKEYADVLEKATQFNRLLGELTAKQESISATDRERIDLLVPKKVDEVRALVDLEYLASEHSMSFRDITAELAAEEIAEAEASGGSRRPTGTNEEAVSGLKSSQLSFTVLGTYEQFRDFLRDLERSLVLMEVVSITFGDNGDGELTNYQVSVRLFALPPEETQ